MVTPSIRFYNFLIDSMIYTITVLILALLLKNFLERDLLKWILIFYYYFYYLIMETIFGQTIGKMITKTRVVATNGKSPSFGRILLRTLLRLVPFDFISYFVSAQGIHDRFSKTELIKIKV